MGDITDGELAAELLTEDRLAKLENVMIILEVVSQILQHKHASYQEAWLDLMIRDIREI